MGNEITTNRDFDRLDIEHAGLLSLACHRSAQEETRFLSPLLLFKFDHDKEGSLTYKEWRELMDNVKEAEKKIKKLSDANVDRGYGEIWTCVNADTVEKETLDRDSQTPAFLGSPSLPRAAESTTISKNESKEKEKSELKDKLRMKHTEEQVRKDAKVFLDSFVQSHEDKIKFVDWLWRLVDVHKHNTLGVQELALLIAALRRDGIMPSDLSFLLQNQDSEDPNKQRERAWEYDLQDAELLLREYDVNKDGHLTRSEFSVLGNMILGLYKTRTYSVFNEEENTIGPFVLKKLLGKGSVGVVRLAKNSITGEDVAIKIISKGNVSDLSRLDTEIKAMLMLNHPAIPKLKQVLESSKLVFFVLELVGGGNLYEFMDGKPLSETVARHFFSQVVETVEYCHSRGIVHRDLKLDNLLIDNNGSLKVTDFGHAGIFQSGWDLFTTPLVGGLCHLAPEQLTGAPYSGEKMDCWSLGVILYQMLYHKSPFSPTQLENIKTAKYTFPDEPVVNPMARDLIGTMFVVDPEKRASCSQILNHKWMRAGCKSCPAFKTFELTVPNTNVWKNANPYEVVCGFLRKIDVVPKFCVDDGSNSRWLEAGTTYEVKCRDSESSVTFIFKLFVGKDSQRSISEWKFAKTLEIEQKKPKLSLPNSQAPSPSVSPPLSTPCASPPSQASPPNSSPVHSSSSSSSSESEENQFVKLFNALPLHISRHEEKEFGKEMHERKKRAKRVTSKKKETKSVKHKKSSRPNSVAVPQKDWAEHRREKDELLKTKDTDSRTNKTLSREDMSDHSRKTPMTRETSSPHLREDAHKTKDKDDTHSPREDDSSKKKAVKKTTPKHSNPNPLPPPTRTELAPPTLQVTVTEAQEEETYSTRDLTFPSDWIIREASASGYSVQPVTAELSIAIQHLIDSTTEPHLLGRGKDVKDRGVKPYVGFDVVSVDRVENSSLWIPYWKEKQKIKNNSHIAHKIAFKTQSRDPVLGEVDRAINEGYLWHPFKKELAPTIQQSGFSETSGTEGLFGIGCYFAEDITKADQYSDPSSPFMYMALCRVCLGNPYTTKEQLHNNAHPQGYPQEIQSLVALPGPKEEGHVLPRFRQFVVYNMRQTYPEYLIKLSRRYASPHIQHIKTGDSSGTHHIKTGDSSGTHHIKTGDSSGTHHIKTGDSSSTHHIKTGESSGTHHIKTGDSSSTHHIKTADSSSTHHIKTGESPGTHHIKTGESSSSHHLKTGESAMIHHMKTGESCSSHHVKHRDKDSREDQSGSHSHHHKPSKDSREDYHAGSSSHKAVTLTKLKERKEDSREDSTHHSHSHSSSQHKPMVRAKEEGESTHKASPAPQRREEETHHKPSPAPQRREEEAHKDKDHKADKDHKPSPAPQRREEEAHKDKDHKADKDHKPSPAPQRREEEAHKDKDHKPSPAPQRREEIRDDTHKPSPALHRREEDSHKDKDHKADSLKDKDKDQKDKEPMKDTPQQQRRARETTTAVKQQLNKPDLKVTRDDTSHDKLPEIREAEGTDDKAKKTHLTREHTKDREDRRSREPTRDSRVPSRDPSREREANEAHAHPKLKDQYTHLTEHARESGSLKKDYLDISKVKDKKRKQNSSSSSRDADSPKLPQVSSLHPAGSLSAPPQARRMVMMDNEPKVFVFVLQQGDSKDFLKIQHRLQKLFHNPDWTPPSAGPVKPVKRDNKSII